MKEEKKLKKPIKVPKKFSFKTKDGRKVSFTAKKINFFKEGLITGFLLAITILLLTLSIYLYLEEKGFSFNSEFKDVAGVQEIVKNCENKTLIESAKCANAHVRQFFSYNISNLGKDLNYSQVVKLGGVCSDFAEIYCQIGKELGFYTLYEDRIKTGYQNFTIKNKTKEYKTTHAFCLWSNGSGYVILDQTSLFKFRFAQTDEGEIVREEHGKGN